MKGYIIYNKTEAVRNSWYIEQYISECAARGAELRLLTEESLLPCISGGDAAVMQNKEPLETPDFVICRTQNETLSRQFELMGAPVYNSSRVSRICNDKFKTYQLAASLGVPVLDTVCTSQKLASPNYPCVLKPLDGKGGLNVYLVKNASEYNSAFEKMQGRPHIVQRAAGELGKDLRVYVMGGRVIAAYCRVSEKDFRSNFCLGGRAVAHEPTPAELDIVRAVCDELKPDFVGVDLMFDCGRPVLNEIEDVVGARMIYANSNINVAAIYVEHILSGAARKN